MAPSSSSPSSWPSALDHPPASSFPSPCGSSPHPITARRVMSGRDDDGLVMWDKTDRDDGSIGKTAAVGVGVTRPKRRLSSLPSLPHPFLSSSHRATGTTPASSPTYNGHHGYSPVLPQSTYQALYSQLVGATTSTNYQSTQSSYQPILAEMYENTGGPSSTSRERDKTPMLWGIELKWISLFTLALQNALLTIIMHYSRISALPDKTYSAASAVLLNELLKGTISVVIALKRIDSDMCAASQSQMALEKGGGRDSEWRTENSGPAWIRSFHSSRIRFLAKSVLSPDCYKLAVPAILYVIQNNLQYVAASNLDVATFQVTYQMKILTTAFFSVVLLRRRLSRAKWASLVMLAVGVGIVQIQSTIAPAISAHPTPSSIINKGTASLRSEIPVVDDVILSSARLMHPLRGFLAVTLACMTSGLAGVYFEFILKSSSGSTPPPDLWVRNTQLSLFSLVPAIVPILFTRSGPDGVGWLGRVMGCFNNFNGWAFGTVLTQTFGGLITAVVIRYSDNIMKGFATSLSIIVSFLASVALFSYPITLAFVTGSTIVLAATYMFNAPSTPSDLSTRTAVAVCPSSPISASAPILGEVERPSRTSSVINLFGLGSSNPSSRRPSANDLRGVAQAHANLSFSRMPTPSRGHGFYSVSAPGTPYLASGDASHTSMSDAAAAEQASPGLTINNPPRSRSPAQENEGNNGHGKDRPLLSLKIGRDGAHQD